MDCSTPGFPVLCLLEFAQTPVYTCARIMVLPEGSYSHLLVRVSEGILGFTQSGTELTPVQAIVLVRLSLLWFAPIPRALPSRVSKCLPDRLWFPQKDIFCLDFESTAIPDFPHLRDTVVSVTERNWLCVEAPPGSFLPAQPYTTVGVWLVLLLWSSHPLPGAPVRPGPEPQQHRSHGTGAGISEKPAPPQGLFLWTHCFSVSWMICMFYAAFYFLWQRWWPAASSTLTRKQKFAILFFS